MGDQHLDMSMRINLPPPYSAVSSIGSSLRPEPKSNVRFYQFEHLHDKTPTADRPDFISGPAYDHQTLSQSHHHTTHHSTHHRSSEGSISSGAHIAHHLAEYPVLRPSSSSGVHYHQHHPLPYPIPYTMQPSRSAPQSQPLQQHNVQHNLQHNLSQQNIQHQNLEQNQLPRQQQYDHHQQSGSSSPQFQYNLLPSSNPSNFFEVPSPPSSVSSISSSSAGRFPSPPSSRPPTGTQNPFDTASFERLNMDSGPSSEAGSRPNSVVELDWERNYGMDQKMFVHPPSHHHHHRGMGDEAILRRNSEGQKDQTVLLPRTGSLPQMRNVTFHPPQFMYGAIPPPPGTRQQTGAVVTIPLEAAVFSTTQPPSTTTVGGGRYQCRYCDKRFARPSSLKIHVFSHTGEKPFKCTICGRGFSVQSNLRRHGKVHERDQAAPMTSDESSTTSLSRADSHSTDQSHSTGATSSQEEEEDCDDEEESPKSNPNSNP